MTQPYEEPDRTLDANAAAGPLAELFAVELTAATAVCASCGGRAALAAHALYADAPALVIRCPSCQGVVLRYGRLGDGLHLELTGINLLVVDPGEDDPPASAPLAPG